MQKKIVKNYKYVKQYWCYFNKNNLNYTHF